MSRASRTLSFTWAAGLPAPVIDGNQAIYRSVMPDVDLIVNADSDGFSHVFRVGTPEAARNPQLARLTLGMRSAGMRVEEESTGVLRAVDTRSGGAVFEAPRPIMWDSSPAATAGADSVGPEAESSDGADGPADGARVAEVAVTVETSAMVLTPDAELLTSPSTTFPVYIDPVWKTLDRSAWTMVSSGYPTTSYWKFSGNTTEGVGFCDLSRDYRCVKDQVKRVLFQFPMTFFSGKYIIDAEFVGYNTKSFSCGTNRRVDLWRVSAFSSSTNWNNDNWWHYVTNRSVGYCSETPVEFGGGANVSVRDEVRDAASRGNATISFGLKAQYENTMDYWKRFAGKAKLRIEYNTPPPQPKMSDLTSNPGGSCSWTSAYVNVLPEMKATLYDADMGSAKKLQAQFAVGWDHDGDGTVSEQWRLSDSALVGPFTSGSSFRLRVPASAGLPELTRAFWKVRSWDGHQWSPWSTAGSQTGCYFVLDTSKPAAPEISSTDYPKSNPDDENDPWYAGVGKPGTFTIDSPVNDATKYWIGINGNPTAAHERVPSTPGGPVTISLAPEHAGLNYVTAKAFNNAGTDSSTATYHFRVSAGTGAKAYWQLDEPAGSSTLADAAGGNTATVSGAVELGATGMAGSAMHLGGAGQAKTSGPVVDTSKSFAVSAWARLPATKPGHAGIIATQAGNLRSGFELYYSSAYDRWIFNRYDADSGSAAIVRAQSTSAPVGGQWAHLVGVYDAVEQQLRLYVNGTGPIVTPYTKPWSANGSVQLGAGWYGSPGSYFEGDIDDVRVFDRVISGDEARDLYTRHPVVDARWKLNGPLDGTTSPDDSGQGHDVALRGGAKIDEWVGWIGDPPNGLVLDGADDYADTTGPVLDSTVESFTVAAWVTAAGAPGGNATVISQVGGTDTGFTLRYAPAAGGYQIEMPNPGATREKWPKAVHPEFNAGYGGWDHVAIVYDGFRKEMRLYVNGQLYQLGDDVSWCGNALGVDADGPLQIGRTKVNGVWGEYWPGVIDDVWAIRGVATEEQIQRLADGSVEHPVLSAPN